MHLYVSLSDALGSIEQETRYILIKQIEEALAEKEELEEEEEQEEEETLEEEEQRLVRQKNCNVCALKWNHFSSIRVLLVYLCAECIHTIKSFLFLSWTL